MKRLSWVLDAVHRRSTAQIAAAIELLLNHAQLCVQDPTVATAALVHFKARPALGYSDCLGLEIACKAGKKPLGTFDRQLVRLDGAQKL